MLQQGFSERDNHKRKARVCFNDFMTMQFIVFVYPAKKFPSVSTDFSTFK